MYVHLRREIVVLGHCIVCKIEVVILLALCAGKQVIRGNASKAFQPFLLPEDMKKNMEELKNKLMVGFDPQKYLISEIEASKSITFIFC